ncbi:MAG TPA: GNAT family N-acetyltransferase [Paludibacter sp.]|nr:GNAT family N-acetyltransferase [Paludibacter sp.]
MKVNLSDIDEKRFGVRTAWAKDVTSDSLPRILSFSKEHKVNFLIARCNTSEIRAAQAMENNGFQIMDTLLYYVFNLNIKDNLPVDKNNVMIRLFQPNDLEDIKKTAAESFNGYFGHYHEDEKLNKDDCDAVYVDWVYNACFSRDESNDVCVAAVDGNIVGFGLMRLNSSDEGEWVLGGIHPDYQGRGIYRSMILFILKWCKSKGANRMVISTQIDNLGVRKVWARLGFEPTHSYYTFHKWF